jgi:hypothetical protein
VDVDIEPPAPEFEQAKLVRPTVHATERSKGRMTEG